MELDVGLAGGGDGLRLVVVDTGGSRLVGLDLGGAGWGGVGRRGRWRCTAAGALPFCILGSFFGIFELGAFKVYPFFAF